VSKAILPYYFDSKENLTLLTMRWVLARVAQRIREAIAEADTAEEASTVVRALVDGLFTQWVQEKDWKDTHEKYRETCKRSVLTYLTAGA
jgi:AcrR family transcriptional regulator